MLGQDQSQDFPALLQLSYINGDLSFRDPSLGMAVCMWPGNDLSQWKDMPSGDGLVSSLPCTLLPGTLGYHGLIALVMSSGSFPLGEHADSRQTGSETS